MLHWMSCFIHRKSAVRSILQCCWQKYLSYHSALWRMYSLVNTFTPAACGAGENKAGSCGQSTVGLGKPRDAAMLAVSSARSVQLILFPHGRCSTPEIGAHSFNISITYAVFCSYIRSCISLSSIQHRLPTDAADLDPQTRPE